MTKSTKLFIIYPLLLIVELALLVGLEYLYGYRGAKLWHNPAMSMFSWFAVAAYISAIYSNTSAPNRRTKRTRNNTVKTTHKPCPLHNCVQLDNQVRHLPFLVDGFGYDIGFGWRAGEAAISEKPRYNIQNPPNRSDRPFPPLESSPTESAPMAILNFEKRRMTRIS